MKNTPKFIVSNIKEQICSAFTKPSEIIGRKLPATAEIVSTNDEMNSVNFKLLTLLFFARDQECLYKK